MNVCGLARLMELRSYNVGFDSLPRDAMNGSISVTEQIRSYPSPNPKLTRSSTDTDIDTKYLWLRHCFIPFPPLISLTCFFVSLVRKRERKRGYTDGAKKLEENVEDEETNELAENAEKTPLYVLTLYTLTSICIFSILFSAHFLWSCQGEFTIKNLWLGGNFLFPGCHDKLYLIPQKVL